MSRRGKTPTAMRLGKPANANAFGRWIEAFERVDLAKPERARPDPRRKDKPLCEAEALGKAMASWKGETAEGTGAVRRASPLIPGGHAP